MRMESSQTFDHLSHKVYNPPDCDKGERDMIKFLHIAKNFRQYISLCWNISFREMRAKTVLRGISLVTSIKNDVSFDGAFKKQNWNLCGWNCMMASYSVISTNISWHITVGMRVITAIWRSSQALSIPWSFLAQYTSVFSHLQPRKEGFGYGWI